MSGSTSPPLVKSETHPLNVLLDKSIKWLVWYDTGEKMTDGISNFDTVDDQYDAANHAPFAPVEEGNLPLPRAPAWTCLDLIHEAEEIVEEYELEDGTWAQVDTTESVVDHHAVSWRTEQPLPGVGGVKTQVTIEYHDNEIHVEAGEPVGMAPGYTVFAVAADADGETVGDIDLGVFRNLAAALQLTGDFLRRVTDAEQGELTDWTPPCEGEDAVDALLNSLGLPTTPES